MLTTLCVLAALTASATPSAASAPNTPTWPAIDDALPATGGGQNDAAVIVGVSAYYDLPAIEGARENAEAWQQYLVRVRKVPVQRVFTFLDKQASKELIERGTRDAVASVTPGGTLWFIFVGHAAPNAAGDDGLLLGADALQNVESLQARGLPQGEVLAMLSGGKQAETIAIFDACFSGRSADGATSLVHGLQATLPVRRPTPHQKVITLSASESFAGPLPGTARPAFSYLLLGALRGWGDDDGDGKVRLQEAWNFARDTMQASFNSRERLPSWRGPSSTLSVAARAQRPDVAALVAGRCPARMQWQEQRCVEVATPTCAPGTAWNGTACASVCTDGQTWNGSTCTRPTPTCPTNKIWDGARCVEGPQTAAYVIPVGDSPILGPARAKVTLTIFSDFQCPFCARVDPMLREAVETPGLKGRLKVVYKFFPLSFHKDARPAAKAALAARELGGDDAFWKMAEFFHAHPRDLTANNFSYWAQECGLDVESFEELLRRHDWKYEQMVRADQKLAEKIGVRGTPSLYVDGWVLKERSPDGIKAVIQEHRLGR